MSDAGIAGRISLFASTTTEMADTITDDSGMGRLGVLGMPVVYKGRVEQIPQERREGRQKAKVIHFPGFNDMY
ncbi:MAG TPA: hypothetical protein VJR94_07245 [Candidatus Nitrosocosmicus sp.]|nr:hypothetical protein [Candidatus Nitrosocosmicus sp.]